MDIINVICNSLIVSILWIGRVEISGQLENVVKQVRTEIDYQEKIALWQDDDTMDYGMTYM